MDFDSVEITALISATSICDSCIAYKTGLFSPARVGH